MVFDHWGGSAKTKSLFRYEEIFSLNIASSSHDLWKKPCWACLQSSHQLQNSDFCSELGVFHKNTQNLLQNSEFIGYGIDSAGYKPNKILDQAQRGSESRIAKISNLLWNRKCSYEYSTIRSYCSQSSHWLRNSEFCSEFGVSPKNTLNLLQNSE